MKDGLFLSRARLIVGRRPAAQHASARRLWKAARARLDVAQKLDPQTQLDAAIPLYREGVIALARSACIVAEGNDTEVNDIDAAWALLERIWPKLDVGGRSLESFSRAHDVMATPTRIDAPSREVPESVAIVASLDALVSTLEDAIEPRTARELAVRRASTIAALAAIPAVAVAVLVPPLFQDKSIALHKPVKTSSINAEAVANPSGEDLVNGKIEHLYGVHTKVDDKENPWVLVDLEQPAPVRRVVVYNRGDGWLDQSLPLTLEVGNDPNALHAIATRESVFTQRDPWTIRLDEQARYIRLSTRGHGPIVLSEVSVYSR